MNKREATPSGRDEPAAESILAALVRHASTQDDIEPRYSICVSCGRRVDGTSKRRYCGRQCATRALLIRRRQARSTLSRLRSS